MVESEARNSSSSKFARIEVSQVDSGKSGWTGIPVIYQLRDSLVATLTPAMTESDDATGGGGKLTHFNMLTVFDNSDPSQHKMIARTFV